MFAQGLLQESEGASLGATVVETVPREVRLILRSGKSSFQSGPGIISYSGKGLNKGPVSFLEVHP